LKDTRSSSGMQTGTAIVDRADAIRWPAEFEPRAAAVHAVNRLDMDVAPAAAWAALIRASEWPLWYANAAKVRIDGGGPDLYSGARFTWRTFGVDLVSHVVEFVPGERIAWTAKAFGVWVYHAWLITPSAGGCHVLTEETQHGVLSRAGALFFPRRMGRWHQRWLEALAQKAR
jgi:Polyketide cyclase / dehydrase and lipid transport